MRTVNIHEAKTHLSRLLEQTAHSGEGFVIAKAGKPVAQVLPLDAAPAAVPRRLGLMAGQFKVPEDFDRMAEDEIETLFDGTAS